MVDKIVTSATRYGTAERQRRTIANKVRVKLPPTKQTAGAPVIARVNLGRWIADCACGGAELVDHADPVFMCFSCGNATTGGQYRPVRFPSDIRQIEAELLKRKHNNVGSFAQPVGSELPREWVPGETIKDLQAQRLSAQKVVK